MLLVFDEVITGFGRTGAPFAAQSFQVTPDIMTLAKALTNGSQPMGAVAVQESIYQTITASAPEGGIEFFHGYTYSGHPAVCAAGNATLKIYEEEQVFANAAALTPYFLEQMFTLRSHPMITDIRGYGLLAGFDIQPGNAPGVRGLALQKQLYKEGLHIKMTGDSGVVAPALVAKPQHVDKIVDILRRGLDKA